MSTIEHNSTHAELHYTVAEIASLWGMSSDTVRRLFIREPGVLVIQHPRRRTRPYKTLRIPESVMRRVYARLTNQEAAA